MAWPTVAASRKAVMIMLNVVVISLATNGAATAAPGILGCPLSDPEKDLIPQQSSHAELGDLGMVGYDLDLATILDDLGDQCLGGIGDLSKFTAAERTGV